MIRPTCLAAACIATAAALAGEPRIVGYVQDRGDLRAKSESIPFALLTHVNVAFVNPAHDAGTLPVPAGLDALVGAARRHGVKVLASLGGGAASGDGALLPVIHAALRPGVLSARCDHFGNGLE